MLSSSHMKSHYFNEFKLKQRFTVIIPATVALGAYSILVRNKSFYRLDCGFFVLYHKTFLKFWLSRCDVNQKHFYLKSTRILIHVIRLFGALVGAIVIAICQFAREIEDHVTHWFVTIRTFLFSYTNKFANKRNGSPDGKQLPTSSYPIYVCTTRSVASTLLTLSLTSGALTTLPK